MAFLLEFRRIYEEDILYCSDIDADNDGDVDAEDLAGFAQYFGTLCYYKDFDGDDYSDGITQYSASQPIDYYLESELIAITGDCDDEDGNVNPGMDEICNDALDNDCDGAIDEDCNQLVGTCAAPFIVDLFPWISSNNTADAEALPNCNEIISKTHLFTFVAPIDGTYVFGIEADYDSVLSLFDFSYCTNLVSANCLGTVTTTLGSSMRTLEISLAANDQFFILIGGFFEYSTGNYTLSIYGP